ncbi:MAG: hypothetical protein H8D71_02465 [Deltaproteobacteria bacterium]|nr:hypothetical protein [Deltaproteobacteria bacterium]
MSWWSHLSRIRSCPGKGQGFLGPGFTLFLSFALAGFDGITVLGAAHHRFLRYRLFDGNVSLHHRAALYSRAVHFGVHPRQVTACGLDQR